MPVGTEACEGPSAEGKGPAAARIDFRELRLPLAPSAFPELERDVRDYWLQVKSVARRSSAVVSESPSAGTPALRELAFYDTPAADLHRRGHHLRTRARIVRGEATAGYQLSLSCRGTELRPVADADVLASPQYEGRDVLREEVAPAPGGGSVRAWSRTCTLREHRWDVGPRFSDAIRIFPGLGDLPVLPTAALRPVGAAPVEELHVLLGELDFGSTGGRISLDVWRDGWSGEKLAMELCVETPFGRLQRASAGEKLRVDAFERLLIAETGDRVAAGRSRIAAVYGRVQPRLASPA